MIDVRLMDSDTPTSSSAGSDMEDNEVGFVLAANIMFYLIIFFQQKISFVNLALKVKCFGTSNTSNLAYNVGRTNLIKTGHFSFPFFYFIFDLICCHNF